MKILIVCRLHKTFVAAFIAEQADALRAMGHEVRFVTTNIGGFKAYIRLIGEIRRAVAEWQPDIVHAYNGMYGMLANFQRKAPVVTTYLGSDVNYIATRPLSIMSACLSAYNIFMSKRQLAKVSKWINKKKAEIMCFGVAFDKFQPMERSKARQLFEAAKPKEVVWKPNDKLVLFSSKFSRMDKDPELARQAVALLDEKNGRIHLLPLTGEYTKEEMMWLINAVDAAILTSKREGSPQFTKEVMACGGPIVSVDVGDIREQFEGVNGCYVADTREPQELANLLEKALAFKGKTNGREILKERQLSNELVAKHLNDIYTKLLK